MPSDAHALVGRETELTRLIGWIDDLATGSGHAVLIEGEPGIGKSSLARAATSAAEQRGFSTYWAECDELGQALPLQPLVGALLAKDSVEPRLDTIQRLLRGELTGAADPAMAAAEQMLALMNELCSASPTVLVVDDLQWADRSTIGVWEWLARAVDRTALVLIGIVRPVPQRDELMAVRRVVGQENTLRLEGLPEAAVTALVATISAGTPGENLLQLADEASGNPLYLTELMDALVRADRLTVSSSGDVEVTDGPVPGSLVAAITDRLDFLPQGTRKTLQAAALLGVEFLVGDLAIVLDRRVAELVPAIDEARTAGVLKDLADKLSFRHPLIRQALYDDIAAPLRPAWHRDAARALAKAGVPIPRVARQLLQAISVPSPDPLDESLLNWVVDAAPTLVAQAPKTAIELLRQAASRTSPDTTRGAVLASRLADALYREGECDEAVEVATRAMRVVTDPELLVDLHWTVSQCRAMLGRSDESLEALEQAHSLAEISAQQRARLLVLTARAHRDLGEVTVAGNVATKALATAEEAGDNWSLGWSLHVLIVVSMMRGEVAEALPLFDRALSVVGDDTDLNDLRLLLQINKAVALGDLDRYDEALGAATRVRQLADHTGSLVRLAQAQTALGELLFEVGRWDDAQAEIETLPDDFKDPGATCCDRGIAAMIAFHRGDAVTARQHLALAAPSAEQIGNRVVSSLTLAHSLDREVDDQPEEALAVLTARVGGDAEELDEVEDLLPEAARLAAYTGAADAAADVAAQAATLARRSSVPHRLGTAAYCRGLLDRDPFLLQHAADRYRDAGRPLLRAKALEAAAIGFAGRDEKDAARAAFTRADELYDRLGANWDLAHLRAHLRRFGIRRGPRVKHRQAQVGWNSLTPTETKIAAMVAEGMSNRQIAEQLVLSPRTVGTHVSHILAKLGVRSRIDIAREAAEHVKAG
ncbi:helix-turn-helix transcriptional regulator [Actinophytocola algeriensis]|uniref:DNA-binding CsgD family transcriptional regulator n=1 Tax=Actinophytocola algeriensis TaxID=1768010 RepID=A0A7W7Q1V3_9PSEU|nr:LuxR family transcriptional regulator [Actinophytocola algeriensis]MBB4905492.1 DNA-binding CsgD family transcriptional regulator [Actinophytocola algeriensis]MBE1472823.1 DNA-binding CsgD family transcriptional regulator [Actinophytocola algeriensis]